MRILVAVPVYNEEQYVSRVLGKVLHFADDVLVIDDGSTDQTPVLLAEQPSSVTDQTLAPDVVRHQARTQPATMTPLWGRRPPDVPSFVRPAAPVLLLLASENGQPQRAGLQRTGVAP